MAKTNSVPASGFMDLLVAADKQRGFPAGTMYSIMKQEVGGNFDKYLQDPAAYHYGLNAEGKRIAGHTGKVSTAFGPFGLLESTAKDPGYGVKPLQDKSIEEQIRFAGDYLDARSKQAGSLQAGLSGYGEGAKYGAQVMNNIGRGNRSPAPAPAVVAQAPVAVPIAAPPEMVAQVAPAVKQEQVPDPAMTMGPDAWQQFLQASRQPVQAADLSYGKPLQEALPLPEIAPADFRNLAQYAPENSRIDFRAFAGLKGRA